MRQFSLDMIPGGAQTAVACNQYESGDTWLFSLYYDGGRYEIPTGAEVSITGTKPDGAAYKIAGTVESNAVQIVVTDQITACAGRSIAEILVESETDGTVLYSANFPLLIEPAAVQGEFSPSVIPTAIVDTDGNIYYEGKSIMGFYPVESASGDVAVIHDGADDLPVRDLSVAIEPVQTGTGVPSPSNVRAISGWSAVKVARTRQNLLPVMAETTTLYGVTFTVDDRGVVTAVGTSTTGNRSVLDYGHAYLRPGTYILSGCPAGGTDETYRLRLGIGSYAGDALTVERGGGREFTITEPMDLYARIYVQPAAGAVNQTWFPMIRLADDSATWTPSEEEVEDITLPTTVYGGTLDVTTGVLTVDRAVVDLGSLSWGYASTRFYATSPADTIDISDTGDVQALCDSFDRYETGALANMPDASFFVNSNKMSTTVKRIVVKDSRYTDAGTFKTAMDGVMLCYALASPRTYTLTPVQVKTLLGENRIYASAGQVTVQYRGEIKQIGVDPTLSVEGMAADAKAVGDALAQIDPGGGGGGGSVTVDTALSSTSTNPVQNKAIYAGIQAVQSQIPTVTNDFTNAYKDKVDTLWADYQSALTALG